MMYCGLGDEGDVQRVGKPDVQSNGASQVSIEKSELGAPQKPKKSTGRKWLYFFLSMAGLYGIWLLVGGFWLPPFTRDTLQDVLREKFRTEASVEDVSFNPFTLNLVIHNVVIPNPDGNGVLFSCTALDFSPSASGLLDFAPGLAHAKLINPVVDVTYFGDGRFSFSQILDDMLAPSPEAEVAVEDGVVAESEVVVVEDEVVAESEVAVEDGIEGETETVAQIEVNTEQDTAIADAKDNEEPEPLFPFIVTDFELVNGTINYRNNVLDVEHNITDINFIVPFTSTVASHKERPITPTLSARINGSSMHVEGNTLPFTEDFATTFTIITDPISLSPFKNYIHEYTEVELVDGSAKFLLNFGVRRLSNADVELGLGGSLFVNDFALQNPSGETVASLKSGEVSIDTFTLAERRLFLDRVALDGLYLKACKRRDGIIDWQAWVTDAQKNFAAKNPPQAEVSQKAEAKGAQKAVGNAANDVASNTANNTVEAESAFVVEGATLALTNSKIVWRDESLVGTKEIALTDIQIAVPNFNTGDGGYAAYDVKFSINNSGLISIAGDATMVPAATTAHINVDNVPLTIAHPFLGHGLISDMQGFLDAEALLAYDSSMLASSSSSEIPLVIADSASVSIRDFSIGKAGNSKAKPVLSFTDVTLSGVQLNAMKHLISAEKLVITGPSLATTLNKANEPMVQTLNGWVKAAEYGLSAQELKKQAKQAEQAKQEAAKKDAKKSSTASKSSEGFSASSAIAASPLKDWTAELKAVTMTDGQIQLDMLRGKKNKALPMGTFSGMAFNVGPISLDMKKPVDFTFETRWQEKGHLQLAGSLTPDPMDLNMTMKAKHMDLSPFDGLAAQMDVKIAGILQTDIQCRVRMKPKDSTPLITMTGNANVQNIALQEFGTSDNFFSLRAFDVKNFAIDSEKMSVKLGAVKVDTPYLAIKIDKDGVSNAERALTPDAAKAKALAAQEAEKASKAQSASNPDKKDAPDKEGKSDTKDVKTEKEPVVSQPPDMVKFSSFVMDGMTVTGGSAFFEDARYSPAFSLRTSGIEVTCSNFSLASESRSNVNVSAVIGGAPFAMQGTMNPVTIPPFADMTANIENMNLVPMTPYSLEYIAYPIEKGTLTADLSVKTADWAVDAKTGFVLNNFELGTYDNRPDAPNYPVKLGLSLLRGLDGSVSIDLPVQGRLDDPNFKIGGVVIKAISNLMLRVVASPFALLGGILSLASGDDTSDTEIVSFTAGQTSLDAVAQRRAKDMIELLQKRPSLSVRIIGGYDEEKDGHMLCILQLVKPMKQQKHSSLRPRQQAKTKVDDIIIDPNEYDRFLYERYLAATGGKPAKTGKADKNGAKQEMPSRKEMEDFFLKDMTCSAKDLEKLAHERALAVKAHLLELAPELQGRVFVAGENGTPKVDYSRESGENAGAKKASQARFVLQ